MLSVQKLGKDFGGIAALNDLSFDVAAGEVVGLIGPNGSGKTTLINLVTGLYRPSVGRICLEGARIDGLSPHRVARRSVARTFQNIRLFDDLTVLENVLIGMDRRFSTSYAAALLGLRSARLRERLARLAALEVLAQVGGTLTARVDMAARQLPYADKRRLEIARALASQPKLLLLDEPAAGMSPAEIRTLTDDLRAIAQTGLTILLVEHKMRLIEGVTGRVVVLDLGRKIADAPFDAVRRDSRVVQAYLGRAYERGSDVAA